MLHVGTSGWSYKHWKGVLYPDNLPAGHWFDYFARYFDTVEINATFYRLFPEATFAGWQRKAPEGFTYAVKLWRWITHRKRLSGVEEDLATFVSRARAMGDTLGPLLVQFPPGLRWNLQKVADFITLLPADLRWVFEIRRKEWLNEDFYALLRGRNIALSYSDYPGLDMAPEMLFGPFIYVRLHGHSGLYSGSYGDEQLAHWAGHLEAWDRIGKDVYVYFNNDAWGHAVRNALTLKAMCGLPAPPLPEALETTDAHR
ncbi:MAG: DUF72 domain-containing protein [Candidatus Zixiibacteriota bacterium]|nr:MAG: DUF72 domain-containing protein [candidate division Zixibacteria bacterium]